MNKLCRSKCLRLCWFVIFLQLLLYPAALQTRAAGCSSFVHSRSQKTPRARDGRLELGLQQGCDLL
uniref:Secreted protein n=1 Tax=Arundo donax TaxID=35708 RepID=A0A0A9F5A9_ARUDO